MLKELLYKCVEINRVIIFISKTYLHSNIKVKFTRPFSGFHSSNKTTIELFPVRFFECRKPAIYYPLNVRFANFMILERCKYNLYVQVWAQKSNEKGGCIPRTIQHCSFSRRENIKTLLYGYFVFLHNDLQKLCKIFMKPP